MRITILLWLKLYIMLCIADYLGHIYNYIVTWHSSLGRRIINNWYVLMAWIQTASWRRQNALELWDYRNTKRLKVFPDSHANDGCLYYGAQGLILNSIVLDESSRLSSVIMGKRNIRTCFFVGNLRKKMNEEIQNKNKD